MEYASWREELGAAVTQGTENFPVGPLYGCHQPEIIVSLGSPIDLRRNWLLQAWVRGDVAGPVLLQRLQRGDTTEMLGYIEIGDEALPRLRHLPVEPDTGEREQAIERLAAYARKCVAREPDPGFPSWEELLEELRRGSAGYVRRHLREWLGAYA